jgi:hypothetical protein
MAAEAGTLKNRIFYSRQESQETRCAIVSNRSTKYKNWPESNLYKAFLAVTEEKHSIRRAAEMYNVPKSTLQDRISGRVVFGAKSGPQSYLNEKEEEELIDFIEGCASIGYSRSKKQILDLVQMAMNEKGKKVTVSQGWWTSFCHRHPNITVRSAEPVSYVRIISTRPEIIERYFDLLEDTFNEYNFHENPCVIFNMDETGMSLNPKTPQVVSVKGSKHPVATVSNDRSQLTVESRVNAAGYAMPPMVIFDRKKITPEMTHGEVPGTIYGISSNGWIDRELFNEWFCHHFLAFAPPVRPLLLLLDGHSTHFNPVTIEKAATENIVIFCLPPHSSHRTQPLDKGCFGPLKSYWRQESHRYLVENPGKVVTRYEFSRLFSSAWYHAMTMKNIMSGFHTTGIYPLNRCSLLPPPKSQSLCKTTDLTYIPLFSPHHPLRESTRIPETPSVSSLQGNDSMLHGNDSLLLGNELSLPFQGNFMLNRLCLLKLIIILVYILGEYSMHDIYRLLYLS